MVVSLWPTLATLLASPGTCDASAEFAELEFAAAEFVVPEASEFEGLLDPFSGLAVGFPAAFKLRAGIVSVEEEPLVEDATPFPA
jgi:hypothetical protein